MHAGNVIVRGQARHLMESSGLLVRCFWRPRCMVIKCFCTMPLTSCHSVRPAWEGAEAEVSESSSRDQLSQEARAPWPWGVIILTHCPCSLMLFSTFPPWWLHPTDTLWLHILLLPTLPSFLTTAFTSRSPDSHLTDEAERGRDSMLTAGLWWVHSPSALQTCSPTAPSRHDSFDKPSHHPNRSNLLDLYHPLYFSN